MLSAEKNKILTEVGPGTPMGDSAALLDADRRRGELDANPIKPVRLMGEDLVLYEDRAASTASSTGTARIAAPTSPTAMVEKTACAATTTAG